VAVLEEGRRYRPGDFPQSNWNVRKYLWLPALRCFGILRVTPLANVMVLHGAGLGGGSLGYANVLLEPPDAFYDDPQWAEMDDWREVLAPHFRSAKRMLGVATLEEATPADELLRRVAEDSGRGHTFRLQDVGVFLGEPDVTVPDPYFDGRGPERTGCNFCGGCMVGCRYGAKNTLDRNYLYLAERLGATLFPETRVELLRRCDGGGYLLETRSSTSLLPRRRSFMARQVVLAAGALGTVNLLLRCREKGTLNGLPPALGARVRTNSEALCGASARNDDVDYSRGLAITSSMHPDEDTHVEPVRYPAGSDLMSFLATLFVDEPDARLRRLKWLREVLRRPIVFLRSCWPFGWARRSVILLVMQTVDNSMRLRRRRRWWWPFGKALASTDERQRARVPVRLPQAQAVTKALAEKMDGIPQSAVSEVLLNAGMTAHVLGGCPIGPDPRHGVIDGQGRVYGHSGLYVVDGSTIPANPGVNPSLTITALAEHAMSHVPRKD